MSLPARRPARDGARLAQHEVLGCRSEMNPVPEGRLIASIISVVPTGLNHFSSITQHFVLG